jgi:integrase
MGMIYKRKYKRKDGTIAESAVWWIKYYRNGLPMRESSESDKEGVAKSLLRTREGDIERGVPITPKTNRVVMGELLDDVLTDYRVNGKRSLDTLTNHIELHLRPFFGEWKAASITPADVRKYVLSRQGERTPQDKPTSNATINRELAALKRAFSLGVDVGKLTHKPKIPMLREAAPRSGFFEREQFEAVKAKLAAPLQPVVHFAYVTGWRVHSEVLPLQWRHVDFEAGTVRLDAGTTKNGEGRVFRLTAELRSILEAQRAYTDAVQRERGCIIPWVFHRDGEQIRAFKRNWKTACKNAGLPGRIPHDFRRTAIRNMVRAGVPERVCMTLSGHKTRSVFDRYNIVSEGDLADAARRLDAAVTKLTGTVAGTVNTETAEDRVRAVAK